MVKLDDAWIAWFVPRAAKGVEGCAFWAAKKGVSVRHLQRLVKRFRDTGVAPKLNPERRPKAPPLTTDEKRLIDEVHANTPRGATKLWRELQRRGHFVPKMKIHAYYRVKGWTKPNPRKQKRRSRCRYEREHSCSLVHADWHRTSLQQPYVIAYLDDASRKIMAAQEENAISTEVSITCFDAACEHAKAHGAEIREVNTDRGTEFYVSPKRDGRTGTSQFGIHLEQLGVRHILSRVNNPQTNGKLERFWHEYDRHRWRYATLQEFVDWHNEQIHDALWLEMYENPREAFQRKLPPEVLLGVFLRQVEEITPVQQEAIRAT
ncbi:MAG: DDE-type integrase/transposase/recombinase [Halobacteriales archaeon]|nr:DDE-type integrase/transposase/recombinase [Halobacteriales archaeon]